MAEATLTVRELRRLWKPQKERIHCPVSHGLLNRITRMASEAMNQV